MSFFSALNTSASGMLAQGKSTSMVSQNIANMTTTGYKKSHAAFVDILATSQFSTGYEPGAVTANRILRTEESGSIQATNSTSNASINGNGFFVVGQSPFEAADDSSAPGNLFFTRNGAFGESFVYDGTSGSSYLANSAGMYLYGYPYDTAAETISGTQDDFTSLVPIDLSAFETNAIPTTAMSFALNLDASEENIDMHTVSGGPSQLPANTQEASFIRGFTVYDSTGTAQNLNFEYRKIQTLRRFNGEVLMLIFMHALINFFYLELFQFEFI